MKSPKPATDTIYQHIKFWWYQTMLNFYDYSPFFPRTMNLSTADLRNYWTEFHETWWSYRYMFLVGRKVFSFVVKGVKVIFWGVQRGPLTLSTHISNFDDIGQCWIFKPHFYAVFWQPFWKWQTSWKFWKRRIAPLMVTCLVGPKVFSFVVKGVKVIFWGVQRGWGLL
jgi:hypothetical protein